jgi:TRAP-type uncharacterized transport system fused permease subunit
MTLDPDILIVIATHWSTVLSFSSSVAAWVEGRMARRGAWPHSLIGLGLLLMAPSWRWSRAD